MFQPISQYVKRFVYAAGASHASDKLSLVLDGELLSSWQTQATTVQTESK